MPYRESVEELAEALADMLGIYSQGLEFVGKTRAESRQILAEAGWIYDHAPTCECRTCWCGRMERRIHAAVAHDHADRPDPVRALIQECADLQAQVAQYQAICDDCYQCAKKKTGAS